MIPIPSALQGLDGPRPKQSGLGSGNGHRTIFGFGRRSSRNMLVALLPLVAAGPASAFEWATDSAADQGMCVSATIPGLCKQKLDALKVSQTGDIIIIPAGTPHGWSDIPDHVDYLSFRPSQRVLTAGYVHPSIKK